MSKLEELLFVGSKIKVFISPTNSNNQLLEIRAIVDEDMFVCREWSRGKKAYIYGVYPRYWFESRHELGYLSARK